MNDQKIELTLPLVNAIIAYLVKQPFEEVANLMAAIQQEAKSNQPQDVPPPPSAQ